MRRRRGRPINAPPEPVLVKDVEPVSEEQYPTAKKKSAKTVVQTKGKKNITLVLPNVKKVDL